MHRAPDRRSLAAGLAIAVALLAAGGGQSAQPVVRPRTAPPHGVGSSTATGRAIAVGQRMIVVLKNPSLADRMAEAGGTATESAMRQWTAGALAAQKQIAARLSREGIQLVPDFVYTRTFNGFAAPIDGRALALLERDEDVFGVYPVRAAYPAALSAAELRGPLSRPAAAGAPTVGIPRLRRERDHRRAPRHRRRLHASVHPRPAAGRARHARSRAARAIARAHPDEPTRLERHGTQMAGLIVGQGRAGRDPRRSSRRAGSCRSASPAGSRAPRAASPSTAAPTSCSPGSSARSIPTPTATSSTPRGSRSSA